MPTYSKFNKLRNKLRYRLWYDFKVWLFGRKSIRESAQQKLLKKTIDFQQQVRDNQRGLHIQFVEAMKKQVKESKPHGKPE